MAISRVDSASWKIGGTGLLFFMTSLIALVTTIACWAFRWIYLKLPQRRLSKKSNIAGGKTYAASLLVSKLKVVVIFSKYEFWNSFYWLQHITAIMI